MTPHHPTLCRGDKEESISESKDKKKRQRRYFSQEDKATILRPHLVDPVSVSDVCGECKIQPTSFYLWQRQELENLSAALQDGRTVRGHQQTVAASL